ncbi:MAG TPA: methyltransferase domain-containing protein [Bryobacteraceae bacterium]|nr:methyltransferase domain-containing protein [Bryobacteraceae bacterium]
MIVSAGVSYPAQDTIQQMDVTRGFTGRLARIQKSFRAKRMQRFLRAFPTAGVSRILDVGGTAEIWELTPGATRQVFLLNMPSAAPEKGSAAAEVIHGDGCCLPFADGSFDIVFSNSVIEHVGDSEAQARFAEEIRRTGSGYWVQTPNRYFPIETHLLTPFVHLLPRSWRAFIVRRFTVWQWIHHPSADRKQFYIEHFISDIRLLSAAEMKRLFPDAVILRERFLLFTKSLVAYRPVSGKSSAGRQAVHVSE